MHLAGLSRSGLESHLLTAGGRVGAAREQARALIAWFAGRDSAQPRAAASFETALPAADVIEDPDGSVRFAVRLDDGAVVEAVLIHQPVTPLRSRERWTVCLSSQAGCARGCVFCETGRLGL